MKTIYAFYPNQCAVLIIPVRVTGILPLFYVKVLGILWQRKHNYTSSKKNTSSHEKNLSNIPSTIFTLHISLKNNIPGFLRD